MIIILFKMQIDFYAEFPTRANLDKLKLVSFPCRVFVAAKSLKEFRELEKKIRVINRKIECAYWPIVNNSYWVSPFSNTSDLVELFSELERGKEHLLMDLEFPMLNKKLILKNLIWFFKNKKLIVRFLEENKNRITTAQSLPVLGWGLERLVGIDYDIELEKSLMFYTSTLKQNNVWFLVGRIRRKLEEIEDKKNVVIGLGVIAKGVLTTEEILSASGLEKDLEFAKGAGFEKVIIFRVGGLNKKYMEVIDKYVY